MNLLQNLTVFIGKGFPIKLISKQFSCGDFLLYFLRIFKYVDEFLRKFFRGIRVENSIFGYRLDTGKAYGNNWALASQILKKFHRNNAMG